MRETIPLSHREPKVNIGAALPLRDVRRLHELAAARRVSLSKLVSDALANSYGTAEKPKERS